MLLFDTVFTVVVLDQSDSVHIDLSGITRHPTSKTRKILAVGTVLKGRNMLRFILSLLVRARH